MLNDFASSAIGTFQQFVELSTQLTTSSIDKQLEDLDKYYTTDAETAKENSDIKLISEKEYEAKKRN